MADGYLLGFDVGSSSIKAALIDIATGAPAGEATSPKQELPIQAPRPGWAEQDPSTWWDHIVAARGSFAPQPARPSTACARSGWLTRCTA